MTMGILQAMTFDQILGGSDGRLRHGRGGAGHARRGLVPEAHHPRFDLGRREMTALDLFSIGSWTLFDHLPAWSACRVMARLFRSICPTPSLNAVHFGDCSANIAAAAGRLGLRAGLGMVVGDDFETSGYRQHLTNLGVDLAGVEVRSGARSGHSYNVFDYENHGFLSLPSRGGGGAGRLDPTANPDRRGAGAGRERNVQSIHARGHRKRERAGPYDGDQRHGCQRWRVRRAVPRGRRHALLSRGEARICKPLWGRRCCWAPHARSGIRRGYPGVQEVSGTRAGTARVPPVPAARFVDSTGAGDAFVAGALFGLLAGLDGPQAGRCAAVVASFVVETWGCQTNLPSREICGSAIVSTSMRNSPMRVIDAHMHYGTDRTVAAHTCVPYLVNGDPESVIRLLDEQGASHGVLFLMTGA